MIKKTEPKPIEPPLPKPDPSLKKTGSSRSGGVDFNAQDTINIGHDVAGRDIITQIIINGSTLYFVKDYEPLQNTYIEPGSIFALTHLDHFSGREWLVAEVDSFLHTCKCGYFILEAEAGLGKTTFLAWLARKRGYIHHFVERRPGSVGIEAGLKNLAAQLILAYKLKPEEAAHFNDLFSLLTKAAGQRLEGEKIVLVIDALDLAGTPEGQNVLGLPETLPEDVFIIVSQRPVPVTLQVDRATTRRKTLHLWATDHHNKADMRLFLEGAVTWPGVAKALQDSCYTAAEFIELLLRKCNGNWIYLHCLICEIDQNKRFAPDLATLPEELQEYYAKFWQGWRKNGNEWNRTYLPLLATLAAAQEDLTIDRLVSWAGLADQKAMIERLLKEQWRPFVAVVGEEGPQPHYYSFYHATLHEFFEGKVDRKNLTVGEKTLVSELKDATHEARLRIIESLLKEMQSSVDPGTSRKAVSSLIRMDWLSQNSPAELLANLELVVRYVDTSSWYSYLADHITGTLNSPSATLLPRERAQLLVYRAAMLGQLGELDKAIRDYKEAENIVATPSESGDSVAENLRLAARIKIGCANIIVIRYEQYKQEEQLRHKDELQIAINLYLQAIKLAQTYGCDPVLELTGCIQLIYAYALDQNWEAAERTSNGAFAVLQRIENKGSQEFYRIRTLETVSELHAKKGESLIPTNSLRALDEYEIAYGFTREEIDLLERFSTESFDLVTAHNNAGEYLLAMSGCTDCQPHLLANACVHWQAALEMARRLGFVDLARDASEYLEEYCASSQKIEQPARLPTDAGNG